MSWQDVLGVRWSWRPRRTVRAVVATAVTVAVVAPLLLVVVGLCVSIGIGWTGVLVVAAVLVVWVSEKWWIVLDPDNLLLWLKFLPGIWRWVHEDDPVPAVPESDPVRHPSFTHENWPTRW